MQNDPLLHCGSKCLTWALVLLIAVPLVGCSSLRLTSSRGKAALPEANHSQAPLSPDEVQGAVDRIDAVRDQTQCDEAARLWDKGRVVEGRKLLEAIVSRNPQHVLARRLLADFALAEGNVEKAERLLLELHREHPDDEPTSASLAWLYESQDRTTDAAALFSQLDPEFEAVNVLDEGSRE